MNTRTSLFFVVAVVFLALGCTVTSTPPTGTPPRVTFPTAQPTPSDFRHGIQGLVDDLADAGVGATIGDTFDGEPLAVQQTIICADGEDVRVFPYGTDQERAAASSMIDPDDPSNVGTAIVEWDGWPKFWQRDRIIVLYLGRDEATVDVLTQLMGEPFAQGQDKPQRLPGAC